MFSLLTRSGDKRTRWSRCYRPTVEALEERCTPAAFSSLNQAFLNSVYTQLFNSPINASGLATWSAYLQGHSRTDTVYQIEIAAPYQFQTAEINQLYEQLLDRPVDPTGLSNGLKFLRQGGYLQQLAANIAGSSEFFTSAGGTATGFLDALFQRGLGRAIDPTALSADQQALASGYTPGQVANGVFHSTEYYTDLVEGYYQQYLQQPADPVGLAGFVSQFQQGAHPEQIIAQFLGSDEFFGQNALTSTSITSSSLGTQGTPVLEQAQPLVNVASLGQSVTFTATVTPQQSGAGTPTGSVEFQDGSTVLGTVALDANGQATFTTSTLSVGSHTISATYGGSSYFGASVGTLTQTISGAVTTTTINSATNPASFGQTVTFTATVAAATSGLATPTGTVTFVDQTSGATLGTATLSSPTPDGSIQATFSTSTLTAGSHTIVATYSGDGNFNVSSGTLTETINQTATSTAVTSSLNPSVSGQAVTLTATISATAPGAGTPTGTVDFKNTTTGTDLGTGTLSNGVATLTTSTLPVGTATITATYSGDGNFTSSSGTLTQTVDEAAPAVTGVSPISGPATGGTMVTISGSSFTGATAVNFGPNPATAVTVVNDTTITATAPAGTGGTVDVTVTTPAGTSATSAADHFSYLPAVTGVNPTSGPATGGTAVTISGAGFTGATAVNFGPNPATGVTVVNDTTITATAPAGTGGTVDVTVTTPAGTSATSAADNFSYLPAVTSVTPNTGPTGTMVTISGSGFTGATAANFGGTPATNVTVVNDTTITANSPAGTAGATVDVLVTTPVGTSPANAPSDQFTFM